MLCHSSSLIHSHSFPNISDIFILTLLEYVFTSASFDLDEKYKREFLDMEGVERSTVVNNVETTVSFVYCTS